MITRWPLTLRQSILSLLVALLIVPALPGSAAAEPASRAEPLSARPGGGPAGASGGFSNLSAAVMAGVVDRQVAEQLVSRGRVDALVTFDSTEILARAGRVAPKGKGRSDAIVRAARPAFASLKARAFGAGGSGAKVLRDYANLGTAFVRFTSAKALVGALNSPGVTGVRRNRTYRAQLAESLPLINQPAAAAAGYTGANTTVAVLDTGLDYVDHAFFGDCSLGPSLTGPCQVAYEQDIAPDDYVKDDGSPGVAYHGTNVAGIVLGVAPGAKVIALDVFTGSGASAGASNDDLNAAIDWLVANQTAYNVRAMNLSLGDEEHMVSTCWDSPMEPSFASARAVGILPVVASGNFAKDEFGDFANGIAYPACTPGAASVGAVYDTDIATDLGCGDGSHTVADQITCFSQSAPIQTLLAPGAVITAAGVTQAGTSQATPHVAGAAAVLAAAKPAATPYQIQKLLTDSGVAIVDPRTGLTKRRLDVLAAVTAANTALPPQPMWADYLAVAPENTWSFGSSLARTSGYLHNIHEAWQGATMQVEYVRSNNGGASWQGSLGGAPTRLNSSTQHGSYAAIATSGNYVYAVWTRLSSAGSSYVASQRRWIYFRSSANQGSTWSSTIKLLSSSTGRVDQPTIAASGGYVYVAWTDSNSGSIKLATSTNYGSTFTLKSLGTTAVTLGDGSGRWGMPVVAAYGSNVAVAWLSTWSSGGYGTLTARVSSNRGSTWVARTLDTDSRDRASLSAVGNRIAFAWVDRGYARLQIWQSGAWQTLRTASGALTSGTWRYGYSPAVALLGTTSVSVAWSACRASVNCYATAATNGIDLLWRESANNGASWKAAQAVVGAANTSPGRRANDAADIEYGGSAKRYIAFQGWTNLEPYPVRMYQRTGVGP